MPEIVGVRFRNSGKTYYFDPESQLLSEGMYVVVETSRGMECGEIVMGNRNLPEEECTQPLKRVVRIATKADQLQVAENIRKEQRAMEICNEKVVLHELDMKLIRAEYAFDGSKVLIYFTSDGRVDFRKLVRDLASVLRTRIELRQIGVRDEAKMLGGLGICGRAFCCSTFLSDFQPVSIKMAKAQGLSLNPTKISGTCGRLMCCLKYEQHVYEELLRKTPRQGSLVNTPSGAGKVIDVSLLTGMLKVLLIQNDGSTSVESFHKDQVQPQGTQPAKERKNLPNTERN